MASVDIKFLPEPLSRNSHNILQFDTIGIIGRRVSSTNDEIPVAQSLCLLFGTS